MSIQNTTYRYLPACCNPIQCGVPSYRGGFIPQYLMTHTEQFALLKIGEKKKDHNSLTQCSFKQKMSGFLVSVFPSCSHILRCRSRPAFSLLWKYIVWVRTGEFISSFILIEVFPRVLNTQTLWFMKICNYTFCLNLQCNLLGYPAPRTENYTNTNLTFRANLIWSLETSMCDIPVPWRTKNIHFSGSSSKQKLWNTAAI